MNITIDYFRNVFDTQLKAILAETRYDNIDNPSLEDTYEAVLKVLARYNETDESKVYYWTKIKISDYYAYQVRKLSSENRLVNRYMAYVRHLENGNAINSLCKVFGINNKHVYRDFKTAINYLNAHTGSNYNYDAFKANNGKPKRSEKPVQKSNASNDEIDAQIKAAKDIQAEIDDDPVEDTHAEEPKKVVEPEKKVVEYDDMPDCIEDRQVLIDNLEMVVNKKMMLKTEYNKIMEILLCDKRMKVDVDDIRDVQDLGMSKIKLEKRREVLCLLKKTANDYRNNNLSSKEIEWMSSRISSTNYLIKQS